MKQDFYRYQSNQECLWFEFESISEFKKVKKVVVYTQFEDNPDLYNLALVDSYSDGSFSDLSISNNKDFEKIISTVIQTLLKFFEKNPSKMVYIEGSTIERTRLYQIIISKELVEIEKIFFVNGIKNEISESFKKNQIYNGFVISLKNKNNLLNLLYENDDK